MDRTTAPELTVYYDGQCPVCSREIAAYRRQAGAERCSWVDASACPDGQLGADLDREGALARMHVRRADGQLVSGALAFATLWQALPAWRRWGRIAAWRPLNTVLEWGYRGFLAARPLWRPADPFSRWLAQELRSDHAGETGAICIYDGILAVTRDPALRAFASHHRTTEQQHLARLDALQPAVVRSRLLPVWRPAGWLTGALPALLGPSAVYATIAAVETFVEGHYGQQIRRLDAVLAAPDAAQPTPAGVLSEAERARLQALRDTLAACCADEVRHRDEALAAGASHGWAARLWGAVVGAGSAGAVQLARRF